MQRAAGVLVRPERTFEALLAGGPGGLSDALALLAAMLLVTAPLEVAAALLSAERSVLLMVNRLLGLYLQFALAPLAWSLGAGLLLAVALRLLGRGRARVDSVLAASAFLWVPMGFLGVLGALLFELGLDAPWLPHLPLGVFLASEPGWASLSLRLVLSYGWSVALFVVLIRAASRPETGQAAARNPGAPAWAAWALAGLLAVGLAGGGAFAHAHREQLRMPASGREAPAFALARADGQGRVALADLRGRPVLVEFWADWCSVCMSHMPTLAAWAARHPEVAVLAVHRGEDPEHVSELVRDKGWDALTFLVDGDERAALAYRADVLPAFFAIGADGIIRGVVTGAPPAGWLEALLSAGWGAALPPPAP